MKRFYISEFIKFYFQNFKKNIKY